MPWNPDRYHQFQKERSAPFEDLYALIRPRTRLHVIDLGCGTGELTIQLSDRLKGSQVVGLDSSFEMLARARTLARPTLSCELGQIEEFEGSWDLIFSHAALQWVEDHPRLIPRLFERIRPGGQLVVQMPSNHDHPAHTLITSVASESPFREALQGWTRRSPVLGIEAYAELLYQMGATDLVIYEKIYPHILADADALAEWVSGTALVPYFERLGNQLSDQFIERYRQLIRARWPGQPVFFGFRRTLFSATKPEKK